MTRRGEHFQAVLDDYQASRRLPTLVAGVLDGGELCWRGQAGGEPGSEPLVGNQYRIGSITKTLTAMLVLQCRDDGLLDLDDPVGRFVPETGYAGASLRELASHTSGMQSEPVGPWWERSPGIGFDALVRANDGSGRVLGAGEEFHYSNLGFALLGEVVARLRGAPWAQVLDERLLSPLGMGRTSYHPREPYAPGLSVHHLRGTLTPEPSQDTDAMAPAGQVWSTLDDLARLLRHLADVPELHEPQPPATDYGLGTKLLTLHGRRYVGHLGSMPGFQATAFIDPQQGDGVVALTNATTGFAGGELTGRLLGEETPAPADPWVPSVAVPDWGLDLLGHWYWGNSALEARWHNGGLALHDLARGTLAERFGLRGDRIVGEEGYHRSETLHVVRRPDGTIGHLECATFVYTRIPYDPDVPIPGGDPPGC